MEFATDPVGRFNTTLQACMLLTGFYGALRGEEICRVNIGGIMKYWEEGTTAPGNKQHVPLVLAGTFKRETGLKFFTQPLACVTKSKRSCHILSFAEK
mmetsp:Transcript_20229/g.56232  ORF Transcript_20229/g.56232 Transcript_20229/m.56232 type:complete len:98 (-) Transcript_20229:400-693(-)